MHRAPGLIRDATRMCERNVEARLNRERMPIWNYTRHAGITGSCRFGLRLRFCLTCLTHDDNVIRGTGHRDTRGGTRTRRKHRRARSFPRVPRRRLDAQRESDNVREKVAFDSRSASALVTPHGRCVVVFPLRENSLGTPLSGGTCIVPKSPSLEIRKLRQFPRNVVLLKSESAEAISSKYNFPETCTIVRRKKYYPESSTHRCISFYVYTEERWWWKLC